MKSSIFSCVFFKGFSMIFICLPMETKTTITGKRARNKKGQLMADDPNTPDVNEAWEGGIAPK